MKTLKKIVTIMRVTKLERDIEKLKSEIDIIRENNVKVYSGLSRVSYIRVSDKYKELLCLRDELSTLKRHLSTLRV